MNNRLRILIIPSENLHVNDKKQFPKNIYDLLGYDKKWCRQ